MDKPKDIKFLNDKASLFKYYANSRNNIEDPLFTGFTLVLDELHSPLFKSLVEPELVTETLRSPGGYDSSLADILETRLDYLNKTSFIATPDSYEMNTMFNKDPFSSENRRRPGYGSFDKYYMENILYGAPDYIYMVDKVTESAYTDDEGVSNVGNGSPSTNIYEQMEDDLDNLQKQNQNQIIENQIADQISPNQHVDIFFQLDKSNIEPDQQDSINTLVEFLNNNPGCSVQLEGYASRDKAGIPYNMSLSSRRADTVKNTLIEMGIDPSRISTEYFGDTVQPFDGVEQNRSVICNITGDPTPQSILDVEISKASKNITDEDKTEWQNLENSMKDALNAYKSKSNEESDFAKISKEQEDLENGIKEQLSGFKKEFQEFKDVMRAQLKLLSGNGVKTDVRNLIVSTYDKYLQFCDYFTHGPSTVNNYYDIYPNISAKINFIEKDQVEKFQTEIRELTEAQRKEYDEGEKEYYNRCWAVLKTNILESKINDDAERLRREYKEKIEKLNNELYGTHPDGRIGTKENPAADSLYGKYMDAKQKFEECPYVKKNQYMDHLNDLQAGLDDLQDYIDANKDKVTTERNIVPIDYEMTADEKENPALYTERINAIKNTRNKYEVPQTYYDMMNFISGMKKITKEYPYVFQTITGLDEAYNNYFEPKDGYMGSGDNKISIECLEFLDLRVSTMFNRYFNAVYDRQYRRERVPINLRRFQCSIFVHDIRNFKDSLTKDGNELEGIGDISNILEFALNYVSAIEFKFYDCEIVPNETGNIFDGVSNVSFDMKKTKFTFTYGNCMINFLPFEDIKKYIFDVKEDKEVRPKKEPIDRTYSEEFNNESNSVMSDSITMKRARLDETGNVYSETVRDNEQSAKYEDMLLTDDSNFRRWFDKSELGNVNNNDYRDYIRHDAAVVVDDHFKTTIVNDFANNSVGRKNQELTAMNDALRKIVVGISASTGIPVKGVTDALNIKFIDPILNERDLAAPVVKDLGNANNSTIVDTKTTEYIGTVIGEEKEENKTISDLGNVEKK